MLGTEVTESAIGLDRQGRIDLQLRVEALGNELGRIDGNIGAKTRQAIGDWQEENGLPPTTYPDARATGVPGDPDRSDDGSRACQA